MSEKIVSRPYVRGHEMESSWPPDEPSGVKGVFHYDRETGEMVPGRRSRRELANVAHGFISDEMDPVAHPCERTGKMYTSKSKFRAVTRAHGCEEVGTAYDNGYEPEREAERDFREHSKNVMNEIKERMQSNGRS